MECVRKNKILDVHPDTVVAVRKLHGLDAPGVMRAAVDELEEWVNKQNHFKKKDFSRHYLEVVLLTAKGSIERAKLRLERGCVQRTEMPQFFGDYDVRNDFKELDGIWSAAILPKLTTDHSRVFLLKLAGGNYRSNIMLQGCRLMFMFCEYMRAYDYSDGLTLVIDYSEAHLLSLATKLHISEVRQVASIVMEGYGARIKGVHFITSSLLMNIMITLFKKVVSAKIAGRIHVHKDLDSLHKVLQKDVLSVDYGGQERSLAILYEEWLEELSSDSFRAYLRDIYGAGVDEALRQSETS